MPYRSGETVHWSETVYDGLGRVIKVIPPDGSDTSNHLSYEYDGHETTVTDAAGKQKKYEYDDMGNVVQKTDARGIVTTGQFDPINRPTQITYSDSTPMVSYVYDSGAYGVGRLYSVSNSRA